MEWVSVDDRLPEEPCECSIYSHKLDLVSTAGFDGKNFLFTDDKLCCYKDGDMVEICRVDSVTMWQPLPSPPVDMVG